MYDELIYEGREHWLLNNFTPGSSAAMPLHSLILDAYMV